MELLWKFG